MTQNPFWTMERMARARAMRSYRAQLNGLDLHEQWRIETTIYCLRGDGLDESAIGKMVAAAQNRSRPWRMSDSELKRAWMGLRKRLGKESRHRVLASVRPAGPSNR